MELKIGSEIGQIVSSYISWVDMRVDKRWVGASVCE